MAWLFAGGILVVVVVALWLFAMRVVEGVIAQDSAPASPEQTVTVSATYATSNDRRMMLGAWEAVLDDESIATRALGRARRPAAGEDITAALTRCEQAGVKISLDASHLPASVAEPTRSVGDGYRDGCRAMRSVQDSQSPFAAIDIVRAFAKVPGALARAADTMRREYRHAGGDPSAIRTLRQKDPAAFQN